MAPTSYTATFFSLAREILNFRVQFEGEVLRMYLHTIVRFQDVVLKACSSPLNILPTSSIMFAGHDVSSRGSCTREVVLRTLQEI